jgi:hypothetical protein
MGLFGGSSKSNSTTNATEQILSGGVAASGSTITGSAISVNDPSVAVSAVAAVQSSLNKATAALSAANQELGQTARQSVQSLENVALSSGKNITEIGIFSIDSIKELSQDALSLNSELAIETGLNLADFATNQANIFTENITALKRQELAGDLATAENITKYVVAGFAIIAIAFIYKGSR